MLIFNELFQDVLGTVDQNDHDFFASTHSEKLRIHSKEATQRQKSQLKHVVHPELEFF